MGTTTECILGLGGGPRLSQFEQRQTTHYLPRVLLLSLCVSLSLSTLTSQFFKYRQKEILPTVPVRHSNGPAMIEKYFTVNPTGGTMETWKPRNTRPIVYIPIPKPDAGMMEEDELEIIATASFEVDANGSAHHFSGFGDGPSGGLLIKPEPPRIYLFVEVPPDLVSLIPPEYPELAREAGVEGTVLVEVLVGEEGFVLEARIKEGLPLLNEAALATAYSAVFRPAQQSGHPVRTRVVIPVEFRLRH